jgi:hypothetical protein
VRKWYKDLKRKVMGICEHDFEEVEQIESKELFRKTASKLGVVVSDELIITWYKESDTPPRLKVKVCVACGQVVYRSIYNSQSSVWCFTQVIIDKIKGIQETNRRKARAFELYDKHKEKK